MANVATSGQGTPRSQLAVTAQGLVAENFPVIATASTASPNTQVVYGGLVGLRGGDIATGILLRIAIAAAGASPTTARFGLADSTGKILVLSGNLNAAANWTAGAAPMPFTAPYTVPADGGYIPCFVVNGTWGGTQPTIAKGPAVNVAALAAYGSNPPVEFAWSGQTDLPAVSSSVTLTTQTANNFYFGVY